MAHSCYNDDVDRISNLSDCVLSHILSLLPTKDAVATSLLSRRWKFLWRNIHNLIFDDFHTGDFEFAHFVNMVFILLDRQSIDKFSLSIEECSPLYDVNSWVRSAVARKVKVVEITIDSFHSPSCLFTCDTLEVLVLVEVLNLRVPSFVRLPNLKSLRLQFVIYDCDECVRRLISGCSSLETLYIERGRDAYDNVVTFTISSPTLRSLKFIFCDEWDEMPEDLDFELEINAPALQYLDLEDRLSRDFFVGNLCSLDQAKVTTEVIKIGRNGPPDYYVRYLNSLVELLCAICNAKHLSLNGGILKIREWLDSALQHASRCKFPGCQNSRCHKMKYLFHHAIQCNIRADGDCQHCWKMSSLLQLHARECKAEQCNIPHSRNFEELKRLV